ncbi:MAG: RES family NAD+ phosphorylase [Rhodospirillaceae bacterium]|nr:RES family NAD+ phosphorylase [Rhodospirillaceae bacterium]
MPIGWETASRRTTRAIGDRWLAETRSALLQVPSAVVGETNIILNPAHPDIWSRFLTRFRRLHTTSSA